MSLPSSHILEFCFTFSVTIIRFLDLNRFLLDGVVVLRGVGPLAQEIVLVRQGVHVKLGSYLQRDVVVALQSVRELRWHFEEDLTHDFTNSLMPYVRM